MQVGWCAVYHSITGRPDCEQQHTARGWIQRQGRALRGSRPRCSTGCGRSAERPPWHCAGSGQPPGSSPPARRGDLCHVPTRNPTLRPCKSRKCLIRPTATAADPGLLPGAHLVDLLLGGHFHVVRRALHARLRVSCRALQDGTSCVDLSPKALRSQWHVLDCSPRAPRHEHGVVASTDAARVLKRGSVWCAP